MKVIKRVGPKSPHYKDFKKTSFFSLGIYIK